MMTATTATPADFLTKRQTAKGRQAKPVRKVTRRQFSRSARPLRTSEILRNILTKNPNAESFTLEEIGQALGETSFGTALMFFTIPEVIPIPVPGIAAIVVLPTLVVSGQMVTGRKEIKLPRFLLKRSVPRKAVVTAVRAIVPLLERAEKVTKPRWRWATTPLARRLLGAFIFLLALAIAFPIPGFNMPQAIATFIIAFGLVEDDGLIVMAGVILGLISLAILGGWYWGFSRFSGFSGL